MWLSAAVSAWAAYVVSQAPLPELYRGAISLGCLLFVPIALWPMYGTWYEIDASSLTARCGPFRWVVPIAEIYEISPTRDPRGSPAFSLDRLCIKYGGQPDGLLVSPADKAAFLAALRAHPRLGAHAPEVRVIEAP